MCEVKLHLSYTPLETVKQHKYFALTTTRLILLIVKYYKNVPSVITVIRNNDKEVISIY